MSKLSYYQSSLTIPPIGGLSLQSSNNRSISFISNKNTSDTYSIVLPITQGTLKQIIAVDSVDNNKNSVNLIFTSSPQYRTYRFNRQYRFNRFNR